MHGYDIKTDDVKLNQNDGIHDYDIKADDVKLNQIGEYMTMTLKR